MPTRPDNPGALRVARDPAGIAVTPGTETRKSLKRGLRRGHARNSAALSVAHSRNIFAGAPVISATVGSVRCSFDKASVPREFVNHDGVGLAGHRVSRLHSKCP